MKFVLLIIAKCIAERTRMKLPERNTVQLDKVSRQSEALTGGFTNCFLVDLTYQNNVFSLLTGPTISYTPSSGAQTLQSTYGDNSYWIGYEARLPISVTGTTIQATVPILVMVQQSTDPIFSDGQTSNGLMGIGFGSLASVTDAPLTVTDAFYSSGAVSKNQIAIHGCPYAYLTNAYIDFGNTRAFSSCSSISVTFTFPYDSYYTVDVRGISIGGKAVTLPTTFQGASKNYLGGRDWSILDSCTSLISIPTSAFNSLKTAITNSNGLPSIIQSSQYLSDWLNGNINVHASSSDFKWNLLPTIDFTLSTGGSSPSLVHIILGPQQYIQADSDGYYSLLVYNAGDDNSVIFGLPFFSAFHVVADMTLGQATVSLGCSCSYSTDGYPQIVMGNSIASVPTNSNAWKSAGDIIGNGIGKQLSSISGGFATCFLASLTADGQTFLVQVDTGSSDTVLPATGLNNYNGPTIPYSSATMGNSSVSDTYGDGSYWSGYQTQYTIGITGTNITGAVPIALMTSQSTGVVFADGSYSNGLMGLGFPILAAITIGSRTIVDGLLSQNVISKNQVGIYGCPYSQIQNAWIDVGNTATYSSCSNIIATITMPYKSYYNINIQNIQIAGVSATLPSTFQSATYNNYGGRYWSFLDTCNSAINFPASVVTALQNAIRSSGGLPASVTYSSYYNQWIAGQVRLAVSLSAFQWSLLPNISITVNTGDVYQSTVTFVLGPQQYIQADANGYVGIVVYPGSDQYAVLGLPFFSAYYVLADRNLGQLQISLGCSCLLSSSTYPKIITPTGTAVPGTPTVTNRLGVTNSVVYATTRGSLSLIATSTRSTTSSRSTPTQYGTGNKVNSNTFVLQSSTYAPTPPPQSTTVYASASNSTFIPNSSARSVGHSMNTLNLATCITLAQFVMMI
ncbi:hypothetical protein HDV06_000036 [Boothiomyces sp. JEL0866]|nr:hypothetical protein HDV06_000036 [Boothiomyces sp. JEL0866]